MIGYYYCSLETFLNIVKNKQIYLSDPLKMNDESEIRWYLDQLNEDKSTLERIKKEALEKHPELNVSIDIGVSLFEIIRSFSEIEFSYDDLINILNTEGQNSIYISCFSKKPDRLSQWRAYADDGNGVSIGFDLEELRINDFFRIEEVVYENNLEETGNDVEIAATEISELLGKYKITGKSQQIKVLLHKLIPVLAKYKNKAFEEEEEIRLIYCEDLKIKTQIKKWGRIIKTSRTKFLEHDYRTISNNDITEYVKLDFDPRAIKEIYIGPKCLLNENNVKSILRRYLGNIRKVTTSEASYR